MNRTQLIAFAKVLFAVMVWGASFIATKVVLDEISPVTVVWLRFALGVLVLGVVVLSRKQLTLPGRDEWGYFALLGFIGITFHQWLQSNGLVTAQASTTAWIIATTPIFMALLGWLVLGEKLNWYAIVGIGLATVGVLLVVTEGDGASLAAGRIGTAGDLLILISAPNWAVFSTLSRRGLQKHPAAMMMFYVMGLGWLFSTLLWAAGPGWQELGQLTLNGWLGVGFLGIFCSGLAYIFWYDALEVIPAAQVGAFLYLEPLVAVGIAAVVLGEPLLLVSLLGGVIILLGVWLVNKKTGDSSQ